MKIKVIGLCGGSGSGKGVVGALFSEFGYLTVDTDKVYRNITDTKSSCLEALIEEFGEKILNEKGTLDRRTLAKIVFSDREKLDKLNLITHKFVLSEVREIIRRAENAGYVGVVVDAPLLYESGFDRECDFVIAVIADREVRIKRIIERDKITEEEAIRRIDSQKTDIELKALAKFVIENNLDTAELLGEIVKILEKIK